MWVPVDAVPLLEALVGFRRALIQRSDTRPSHHDKEHDVADDVCTDAHVNRMHGIDHDALEPKPLGSKEMRDILTTVYKVRHVRLMCEDGVSP